MTNSCRKWKKEVFLEPLSYPRHCIWWWDTRSSKKEIQSLLSCLKEGKHWSKLLHTMNVKLPTVKKMRSGTPGSRVHTLCHRGAEVAPESRCASSVCMEFRGMAHGPWADLGSRSSMVRRKPVGQGPRDSGLLPFWASGLLPFWASGMPSHLHLGCVPLFTVSPP